MPSLHRTRLLAGTLLCAGAAFPGSASSEVLQGARLTVGFDTNSGLAARNHDRIDSIVWTRSDGSLTGNLAVNSTRNGEYICGDPAEFFGQSVGGPFDATKPFLVQGGDVTNSATVGNAEYVTRKLGNSCGYSSAAVTSQYRVFNNRLSYNEIEVTRVFGFTPNTPVFPSDLRAYIPRIDGGIYATDLVPDKAGVVQSYSASACSASCTVTDWNGRWIAEDDGHGSGMVIIRSLASRAPANAVVDSDAYSGSNASSVLLTQPAHGWTHPVVEVEYLCFYDAASWPKSDQAAGRLPKGCSLR